MKRSTMNKVNDSKRTGSGGTKLTPLDHIILDIVGMDSAQMTGLGLPDDGPIFQGLSQNRAQSNDQENFDMSFSSTAGKFLKKFEINGY